MSQSQQYSPIWHLSTARFREFIREPEAVFWTFFFPPLLTLLLGLAFKNKPIEQYDVDVVAGSSTISAALTSSNRFNVNIADEEVCLRRLRTGKTPLVVRDDAGNPTYLFDPDNPESRTVRFAVDDTLQRNAGRKDPLQTTDVHKQEPGGRYVDFLVPGLLGMGIMGGGIWGLGFVTVDMRLRKVLKRFVATPMRRFDFLLALMLSRLAFLIPEVLILLVFAHYFFDVRVYGSWWEIFALILLGTFMFSGIGLLVGCRAKTMEGVSGLMNLVMLPMWVLSGIFFSSDRFPEVAQPFIKALPLTALLDAMRPVMLEGARLWELGPQIGVMVFWLVFSFATALKLFRWS